MTHDNSNINSIMCLVLVFHSSYKKYKLLMFLNLTVSTKYNI